MLTSRIWLALYWSVSARAWALPTNKSPPRPSHHRARPGLPLSSPEPPTSLLHRLQSKLRQPIRGSRYVGSNSTILTPTDAAQAVGVQPTFEASKWTWQTAWRVHRFLLQFVLHWRAWDRCRMEDSKLALAVLWWKAM